MTTFRPIPERHLRFLTLQQLPWLCTALHAKISNQNDNVARPHSSQSKILHEVYDTQVHWYIRYDNGTSHHLGHEQLDTLIRRVHKSQLRGKQKPQASGYISTAVLTQTNSTRTHQKHAHNQTAHLGEVHVLRVLGDHVPHVHRRPKPRRRHRERSDEKHTVAGVDPSARGSAACAAVPSLSRRGAPTPPPAGREDEVKRHRLVLPELLHLELHLDRGHKLVIDGRLGGLARGRLRGGQRHAGDLGCPGPVAGAVAVHVVGAVAVFRVIVVFGHGVGVVAAVVLRLSGIPSLRPPIGRKQTSD